MKFRILSVVAALLVLFTVNVAAESALFDISVDKSFCSAYRGDDVDEVAEIIGADSSELSNDFNKGGLLYFAVSRDNTVRIRLSEYSDNFSVEVGDISRLDDSNMESFLQSLGEKNGSQAQIVENGGRKYAVTREVVVGESGVYTVTQYITVCGGKTYYLSCYNEGDGTSDTVEQIFKSLKLSEETANNNGVKWQFAAIAIGIAVFVLIAVIAVIGLIKNLKIK